MRAPKPPDLVEGEDFYKEGVRMVFTEAYHLKRGYCCNSKCRHCPYRQHEGSRPQPPLQLVVPKLKLP